MERAYLQWTLPNWITVGLMGATFFVAMHAATSLYRQYKGGSS